MFDETPGGLGESSLFDDSETKQTLFGDTELNQTLFDDEPPAPVISLANERLVRRDVASATAATARAAAAVQTAQAKELQAQADRQHIRQALAQATAKPATAATAKPAAAGTLRISTPDVRTSPGTAGGRPAPAASVPAAGGFQPSTQADLDLSQAYELEVPAPGLLARVPWWGWVLGVGVVGFGTWYGYRRWSRR